MSTVRRSPGARVFTRDTFSFLGGWGLIIYQGTVADPFNWAVFAGGIVIVMVPGAAAAWAMRTVGVTPTASPSSGSLQEASSEPPS